MKSPFPGMDPYLEQFRGDVSNNLTTYARDAVQRQLPGDLQARVEDLVDIEDPSSDNRYVSPDVMMVEKPTLAICHVESAQTCRRNMCSKHLPDPVAGSKSTRLSKITHGMISACVGEWIRVAPFAI